MYIKNKILGLLWKGAIVVCAFIGVGLQIGIFRGELNMSGLRYFTNLSNLLCMFYFLVDVVYLILQQTEDGSKSSCFILKGVAMIGITVIWLVAQFMLGDSDTGADMRVSVRLVHFVIPVLTILDWLLFDEKGRMNAVSPLFRAAFPLGYFAVIMLCAALTSSAPFYPYPFMDVSTQGLPRVLVTVTLMAALFIALGYSFVFADRLLSKRKRRAG